MSGLDDQGRVHRRPCGRRWFRREEGPMGDSGKGYIVSRTENLV